VLDVGVGGGSTSLPLAARARSITGVDASAAMLEAFAQTARGGDVHVETVEGTWPEVAGAVSACDVVVCGHVLYNVQDVVPFVRALDEHAAHRVVIELTEHHPWTWMNDLWSRFHGIDRPASPTADDARAVLAELGLRGGWERREVEPQPTGFERRDDAVALVRRRLCLPADADEDVAAALGDRLREIDGRWSTGPASTTIVTTWWETDGRQPERRAT
jgi:SAM-dependent methyltransferase